MMTIDTLNPARITGAGLGWLASSTVGPRIAFAAEDETGTPPAADTAPEAAPEAKSAESILYGKEGEKPAGEAEKPVEGEAKAEGEEAKDGEKDAKSEVPEAYDLKMPDGVELDAKALEQFTPVLKDLGLNNEQAQKLTDVYAAMQQAQGEQWAETQNGWVKAARTDKEFGGDKFDASVSKARGVLDKFGTSELKEALTFSGMGNHPEVIRFMTRVAGAISEDDPVGNEAPAGQRTKDHAEILYPQKG
jgi:hypothetical protein